MDSWLRTKWAWHSEEKEFMCAQLQERYSGNSLHGFLEYICGSLSPELHSRILTPFSSHIVEIFHQRTHSLPVYYSLKISLKSMGQRDAQKQTHEFTFKINWRMKQGNFLWKPSRVSLKIENHLDKCFIISTLLLIYIPNKNIVKQATTDAFNEVILTSYWGIQTKRNPPTT